MVFFAGYIDVLADLLGDDQNDAYAGARRR
jgi:hypothetical protein